MVAINVIKSELDRILPQDIPTEELDQYLAFCKAELEAVEGEELKIDIKTSARPDLWSMEGLVREMRGILEEKPPALPELHLEPSGYVVEVDPGLKEVRPFIACAVVRGIELNDDSIRSFMQTSEKIDVSYGRKRKRTSIGIYNLEGLSNKIYYRLQPASRTFIPLGWLEPISLAEILEKHEKGKEYGYILGKADSYPLLDDEDGHVLSMPPIINSNDVGRVTEETREALVEVTGSSYEAVNHVLNILVFNLQDHGVKVESVLIQYPNEIHDGVEVSTPDLETYPIKTQLSDINSYLGMKFSTKQVQELLQRRRIRTEKTKGGVIAYPPPYRKEMLHWVDVTEEVAIAYGYNNFEPTQWNVVSAGGLTPQTESEYIVRQILIGAGYTEVLGKTLLAKEVLTAGARLPDRDFVEVANPISANYATLRDILTPYLLLVLSQNTHVEYPQAIFEVGEVCRVEGGTSKSPEKATILTQTNLALAYSAARASFEQVHTVLEILSTTLRFDYELKATDNPMFLEGRAGQIIVGGTTVGLIGEVHPETLNYWKIGMPVVVMELELRYIPTISCVPFKTFL